MNRFVLTFACIAVFAGASALRVSEVPQILAQIDQKPLGNALLSTIHL
jgi:septal ring factor EnvC (AmiA/AmiB activator)